MNLVQRGMRYLVPLLVFAIAISFAPGVYAQTSTTGSIQGAVKDPSGAAVPGVTITATSPNSISPGKAVSGSDGSYFISNLPPGYYTLSIPEGKGFGKLEQANVLVNLGKTTAVDFQLRPQAATTEVTVSTAPPAVDTTTTASGSNVNADQFENFPTARTVQGLFTIAPSVTRSGLRDASGRDRDPSVAGSSGPENNYILDGVSVSDPAYGGGGATLPFEFVQEVEIKTGAYSAEYGKSTGGIFNVITKSGGNNFHGDVFGYFTPQSAVRAVTNFPFTGSSNNGFSEKDFGGDIGGPIVKNKLWFFGAVNPQFRTNNYLTQTFHAPAKNDVTIPFYAGKLTWAVSNNTTFTFSTFSDRTTVDGFVQGSSGFGSNLTAFEAKALTGGSNYAFRLNSALSSRMVVELSAGLHFQRSDLIPRASDTSLMSDSFAVLQGASVLPVTNTGAFYNTSVGYIDYVDGRGGTLERGYLRGPGYGLMDNQDRNRYEMAAHLTNTFSKHNLKYGFELSDNIYNDNTISTGPPVSYADPYGKVQYGTNDMAAVRISNNFSVCTVRATVVVCPSSTAGGVAAAAFAAGVLPANITGTMIGTITQDEAFNNPFIFRLSTRARDYEIHGNTHTKVTSAYIQDDWKLLPSLQLNLGLRWDFQTSFNTLGQKYLKLNRFLDDTQPRLGLIWDFTGNGKGKFEISYARFLETPVPLDLNMRAAGGGSQIDKNINVDTYNGPAGAGVTADFGNLGAGATPIDPDLRPQTLEEYTAGVEYAITNDFTLGVRGVYRNYLNIIEDGSFDDGINYFLFNPGRKRFPNDPTNPLATTEDKACADPTIGCFGPARRYYRAIEATATKRWSKNFQFIASYTFSSLIGNYEGLYRNDNGQSDPNITSLFDLVSLLKNTYGRLPNDRPHQFKFNGSWRTPLHGLMFSGNYYIQSGTPFNQLIPHPVYGNNEGFGLPRGTAIVPAVTSVVPGFPNKVNSVASNRTPVTSNLDMGFYYPIKISEHKEFRLSADWFNVFNQQRAITLDQTYSINSGVTGVPPTLNPFYGAAVVMQPPSQWRFGAKFSF